jgi:4-hydroxy-tetrahydrodipicolinate synthase
MTYSSTKQNAPQGTWLQHLRLCVDPLLSAASCSRHGCRYTCTMAQTKISLPTQRIRGVLAPVVTPFKADLSPDRERFIRHCQWLLSQNCGLAVFGTNSEANSMSAAERMSLLDALIAAGLDPSRMMPGTGCCSMTETVELTAHAVKHRCAGVLMLPPFYYKNVNEEGLYRYFSEVVQRVGDTRLKIYLYNIPPVAIVGITPKLVERLLNAYPAAIAGMKDSSGDWNNTKTFLDAFAVRAGRAVPEFDVFVGSESFLLANMRKGGVGTISATANVNPAAIHELCCCSIRSLSGSRPVPTAVSADLEQQQFKLNVVRDVFSSRKFPSMIAALKRAIAIYANDPEWARVRPPLIELTRDQANLLAEDLKAIGFVMPGIAL